MLNTNNILDIAVSAMTANQTAMNTVGQNIANVNTPFYNNESPILSESPPVVGLPYTYGTGVNVTQIQRSTNDFVQSEVNNETSLNNYYTTLYQNLNQVQNLFNDQSGSGFSSSISQFFNDFQNVANNPSNTAQRTTLLSDANSLTSSINNAYTTIMDSVASTNTSINGIIPQINSLTSQIASLNKQVAYSLNNGGNANEYEDQRSQAMNNLAKLVNVSYYQNQNGEVNMMIGDTPIVLGDTAYNLSAKINSTNGTMLDIYAGQAGGSSTKITGDVSGGSLGAYVQYEQSTIPSYVNQLNSLAAAITDNVNSLQYNGYGLDGSTGNYFFNPDLKTAVGTNSSSGSAVPVTDATINTGYITDPSKLTGDNYTITSNGTGGFTVSDTTTGQNVDSSNVSVSNSVNGNGQSVYTVGFDGVSVNITTTANTATQSSANPPASGDTFTVNQLTTNPAYDMSVNPNLSVSQVAAASAVSTAVNPSNSGNATISSGAVINPYDVTGGTVISGSNEGGQYNIMYVGSGLSSNAAAGDTSITVSGNFATNSNSQDNFVSGQQILIGNDVYNISSTGGVSYNSSNNTTTINIANAGGLTSAYSSGASVSAFSVKNSTTGNSQYIAVPPTTNSTGQNSYSLFFGNNTTGSASGNPQNFQVGITGSPSNGDTFTANVLSPSSSVNPSLSSSVTTPLTLSQMNSIGLAGNNENALSMAALQNNNLSIDGSSSTVSTYYSNIVSNIGTESQSANTNYTNSSSVLTNLQNQLSSSVGVNMNKQMTDLVNYQNSYQAAAAIVQSAQAIMNALLSIVP